jgi:adenylate kinase family enzyme
VIIVEGPDGSGKSTLVAELAKALRLPVANRVVSESTEAMTNLKTWTEDNVAKGFQPLIFDRHRLISEPIYGPVIRDRQDGEFFDMAWLSQQMWLFYGCKPVIIYCLPNIVTVRRNLTKDNTTPEIVKRRTPAIYASYVNRATLDFTRGVGRLYNYETTKLDDIIGWVQMHTEDRITDEHRVRLPIPRGEGVHPRSVNGGRSAAGSRAPH